MDRLGSMLRRTPLVCSFGILAGLLWLLLHLSTRATKCEKADDHEGGEFSCNNLRDGPASARG